MKKFIGYSIAIIGVLVILLAIFASGGLKDDPNGYLGILVIGVTGGLLVYWGRSIIKAPKFIKAPKLESPENIPEYEGYWKAKCGWYLLGGIALGGVAIAGWMTMPPAGVMGTLLSFKFFQSAYKAYYD